MDYETEKRYTMVGLYTGAVMLLTLLIVVGLLIWKTFQPTACAFRIAPDLSEGVVRIPDDEASAYYDGRKLVNDNQRNYIDSLAERSTP
jgi:hypothetical protein